MFQFSDRKVVKLNKFDAAIVLKEDGSVEASFPEITTETVSENILTGAAIMYALSCPDICQVIRDKFLRECCPVNSFKPSNDR